MVRKESDANADCSKICNDQKEKTLVNKGNKKGR